MTDDATKPGRLDRDQINVNNFHELNNWARYFGVSDAKIREVVAKVGPMVPAVRTHLANEPWADYKKAPRSGK